MKYGRISLENKTKTSQSEWIAYAKTQNPEMTWETIDGLLMIQFGFVLQFFSSGS